MGKALLGELSCPCDRSCLSYYFASGVHVTRQLICFRALGRVRFYPIALRTAKTLWSFGHSEGNSV